MNDLSGRKLIVAFLSRGVAHEIAAMLYEKLGLDAFHYGHGRGAGLLHTTVVREMPEVDLMSVVVSDALADEVFGLIYEAGQVDRPGGGLVIQMPLSRAVTAGLPAIAPESLSGST